MSHWITTLVGVTHMDFTNPDMPVAQLQVLGEGLDDFGFGDSPELADLLPGAYYVMYLEMYGENDPMGMAGRVEMIRYYMHWTVVATIASDIQDPLVKELLYAAILPTSPAQNYQNQLQHRAPLSHLPRKPAGWSVVKVLSPANDNANGQYRLLPLALGIPIFAFAEPDSHILRTGDIYIIKLKVKDIPGSPNPLYMIDSQLAPKLAEATLLMLGSVLSTRLHKDIFHGPPSQLTARRNAILALELLGLF